VNDLDKSERLSKKLEKSDPLTSILSSKLLQFEAREIDLNLILLNLDICIDYRVWRFR